MPNLNQTGPLGQGPMTGRRMGRCTNFGENLKYPNKSSNQNSNENFPEDFQRQGFGRRFGMRQRNRFRGNF